MPRKLIPISIRFWSKVDHRSPAECWPWIASKNNCGYGQITLKQANGRWVRASAHKLSYELTHGPVPNGLCVLHYCDNPACVNPSHLWLGTMRDNNDDCMKKGRHKYSKNPPRCPPSLKARGSRHGIAKLTESAVLDIRAKLAKGATMRSICKETGMSMSSIADVRDRVTWRHI